MISDTRGTPTYPRQSSLDIAGCVGGGARLVARVVVARPHVRAYTHVVPLVPARRRQSRVRHRVHGAVRDPLNRSTRLGKRGVRAHDEP